MEIFKCAHFSFNASGAGLYFLSTAIVYKIKTDIATCLANTSEAIKEPEALELASPKLVAQQPILEQAPLPRADTNFQCAHLSAPILEYQAPGLVKRVMWFTY